MSPCSYGMGRIGEKIHSSARAHGSNSCDQQDIRVYVIHSWTKIWSCPGIRLGSVVCPTIELATAIKKHQVPWSLNVFALRFLSAAIKDTEYLQRTWSSVPRLRTRTTDQFTKMFPK